MVFAIEQIANNAENYDEIDVYPEQIDLVFS